MDLPMLGDTSQNYTVSAPDLFHLAIVFKDHEYCRCLRIYLLMTENSPGHEHDTFIHPSMCCDYMRLWLALGWHYPLRPFSVHLLIYVGMGVWTRDNLLSNWWEITDPSPSSHLSLHFQEHSAGVLVLCTLTNTDGFLFCWVYYHSHPEV